MFDLKLEPAIYLSTLLLLEINPSICLPLSIIYQRVKCLLILNCVHTSILLTPHNVERGPYYKWHVISKALQNGGRGRLCQSLGKETSDINCNIYWKFIPSIY